MIVLHGLIIRDEFLLWGEVSESSCAALNFSPAAMAEQHSAAPAETGSTESSSHQLGVLPGGLANLTGLHPFASTYSVLQDALAQSPAGLRLARRQNAQALVSLPTLAKQPLASTPLIGRSADEMEDAELEQVSLERWVIPVIRLSMPQLIELLCHCLDQEQLTPGLVIGQDLQYWSFTLRFAGNLINKQHFLPGLRIDSDGGTACWEPVFLGEDGDRLIRLAKAMPASCLAENALGESEDIATAAGDLLVKFIGKTVDALVRQSYDGRRVQLPVDTREADAAVSSQLHARWLRALIGSESALSATTEELASLSCQIAEWRRPVAVASDSPYRLCFRLEQPLEPEPNPDIAYESARRVTTDKFGTVHQLQIGLPEPVQRQIAQPPKWYLRFLLQSIKDPSQVLSVETVLSPAFDNLQLLRGGSVSAREYLFRSLGQAVRLFPQIAESFNQEQPLGLQLDTKAAYDFLAQKAPLLKAAGFSIQLPGWWTEQRQRFSLKLAIKGGAKLVSLDELAEFDWQVALGNEPISQAEIENLSQLKMPLVCINGHWTELNKEQLTSILAFVKKRPHTCASGRDLVKMALGDLRLPEATSFGGITGDGIVVDVLNQLAGQTDYAEIAPPTNFVGELRPYQIRGVSWLEFLRKNGFGACLADDMGLGKTVQTLAFLQQTRQQQAANELRPTLLVCPTSLLGNWLREAEKFTPELPVILHHGPDRARGASFLEATKQNTIVLTTYTLLQKDLDDFRQVQWDTIVLDEAQNIKNPYAQQSQAAFALTARFKLALTGTPVENNVSDLWSLMHFLNPGFLGRQADFHERYFIPIQVFQDQEKIKQLRKLTSPFILRRLKTDKNILPDLPAKLERKTTCTLTKEQASLYAAVVADATAVLDQASGMKR